jgi:hypothetical protein
MARKYRRFIPQTLSELLDRMSFMLLYSPTFEDDTGYFPEQNLDNSFDSLNEGLSRLRRRLGEELYQKLAQMSDQARSCFEADPEDTTGETRKGKRLILAMEALIEARAVKRAER